MLFSKLKILFRTLNNFNAFLFEFSKKCRLDLNNIYALHDSEHLSGYSAFSDKTKLQEKTKQKHHQKLNNFYFIYKSPGAMLEPAEHTRNDVWRPLNYEKPPKIRRFSYQSATVGLPIVNQSYHADGRALHYGAGHVAVLSRLYLEGF